MGDVVDIGCITKLDIPPDRLLEKAIGNMSECVILGFHIDGSYYFASSKANARDVFYHLERAKYVLLKIIDA